jgi:REP element-mobilizing transposase RayT
MPRSPRINAKDLIYHVFARGNNRDPIFFDAGDYERFLKNLERYRDKFKFTIYAYCLLPNHFHLLLRPGNVSLSEIMQPLMTAHTMYVNKKYDRVGHVFQGRFKSIVVQKENYLLQVLRYIHLNPVKAGTVEAAEEYPWSSYLKYLTVGGEPQIDIGEILAMFSDDRMKQKQLFVEFTTEGLGVDFEPEREQVRGILGKAEFVQILTRRLKGVRQ